MGITNKDNTYNVSNIFNDIDAFNCNTPTTYYPIGNSIFLTQPLADSLHTGNTPTQLNVRIPPFSNIILFEESPTLESLSNTLPQPAVLDLSKVSNPLDLCPNTETLQESEQTKPEESKKCPRRPKPVKLIIPPKPQIKATIQTEVEEKETTSVDQAVPTQEPVTSTTSEENKEVITVQLKPARKTGKFYIEYFPDKLYCAPYKYDARIRFDSLFKKVSSPEEQNYLNIIKEGSEPSLIFKLLDGETRKKISKNSKGDPALLVEKCKKHDHEDDEEEEQVSNKKRKEVVYRLCFTICSFHNHRRPFIIQCFDKSSNLCLFESNPFHIYARKNNKDKNGDNWLKEAEQVGTMKILFSGEQPNQSQPEEDEEMEEPADPAPKRASKKASKGRKSSGSKRKRSKEEVQEESQDSEEMEEDIDFGKDEESEEAEEKELENEPKRRRTETSKHPEDQTFKAIYQKLGCMFEGKQDNNPMEELDKLVSE